MAALEPRWLRRNVSQRSSAPGGGRRRGRHLDTLRSETSKPSMSSSPWMRGAPQVGFSNASPWINARRRGSIGGRPRRRRCESQVQERRKLAWCQRTTVSGFTKTSTSDHRNQSRRRASQNSRSAATMRGRRPFRANTASCCRSARFSSKRSARERKTARSTPIASREATDHDGSSVHATGGNVNRSRSEEFWRGTAHAPNRGTHLGRPASEVPRPFSRGDRAERLESANSRRSRSPARNERQAAANYHEERAGAARHAHGCGYFPVFSGSSNTTVIFCVAEFASLPERSTVTGTISIFAPPEVSPFTTKLRTTFRADAMSGTSLFNRACWT